jgi:hypothetical protein
MTILWGFDEKHPKQVSAMSADDTPPSERPKPHKKSLEYWPFRAVDSA